MTPLVTVIVPVLDMAETIGPCLTALTAQSLSASAREIIVVDNGSTDDTCAVVRGYPVTLLEERAPGAANARNHGLRAARGEFVAFTDADCVPSRGWLAHLIQAAGANDVDAVAGPMAVLDPESSLLSRYSATVGQYDPRRSLAHPLFPYAVTANLCVRRSVFDTLGLFNPAFPTFDAAELFWRMTRLGPLRATVEPRAVVFYRTRQSVAGFLRQNYGYGQGAGRLWRLAGRQSGTPLSTRAVMQACGRRLGDAGRIARAGSDASPVRFLPLCALHLMRESAIAAGFFSASLANLS